MLNMKITLIGSEVQQWRYVYYYYIHLVASSQDNPSKLAP